MKLNTIIIILLIFISNVSANDNLYIIKDNKLTINTISVILSENIRDLKIDSNNTYPYTNNYVYSVNSSNGGINYKININSIKDIEISDNYIYVRTTNKISKINKLSGIIEESNLKPSDNIFTYMNSLRNTDIFTSTDDDSDKISRLGDTVIVDNWRLYSQSQPQCYLNLDSDTGARCTDYDGYGQTYASAIKVNPNRVNINYVSTATNSENTIEANAIESKLTHVNYDNSYESNIILDDTGISIYDSQKTNGYACWTGQYQISQSTPCIIGNYNMYQYDIVNTNSISNSSNSDANMSGITFYSDIPMLQGTVLSPLGYNYWRLTTDEFLLNSNLNMIGKISITSSGKGIQLTSPNGSPFCTTVSDLGVLTTVAGACT
jgi:hypothetical protein